MPKIKVKKIPNEDVIAMLADKLAYLYWSTNGHQKQWHAIVEGEIIHIAYAEIINKSEELFDLLAVAPKNRRNLRARVTVGIQNDASRQIIAPQHMLRQMYVVYADIDVAITELFEITGVLSDVLPRAQVYFSFYLPHRAVLHSKANRSRIKYCDTLLAKLGVKSEVRLGTRIFLGIRKINPNN